MSENKKHPHSSAITIELDLFGEDSTYLNLMTTKPLYTAYGTPINFNKEIMESIIYSYENKLIAKRVPIIYDHGRSGSKAAGWIENLEIREGDDVLDATLVAKVAWNKNGKRSVGE